MESAGATRQLLQHLGDATLKYVKAMDHGLNLLDKLPICTRLLNEIHGILLQDARGSDKRPGELRSIQNWIGESVTTPIEQARFVPPPPALVPNLLADWEAFVNDKNLEMPPLVQCALMHYQFEAIHPYVDGNGRIARLAIVLFLTATSVLPTPLLYLSDYFERNSEQYYQHLFDTSRTGEWAPWLQFFLDGVFEQSIDALDRSRRIRDLQTKYRTKLLSLRASARVSSVLDQRFINPYVSAPSVVGHLAVTNAGAQGILKKLEEAGILSPLIGSWPRIYIARELLDTIQGPAHS